MPDRSGMHICAPQLGLDPAATLGGAVYDRTLLTDLARLGATIDILLPSGEPHPDVAGWNVVFTRRHRWSYYEYNLIFRQAVRRLWRGRLPDILRIHSPYSVGLGLLDVARRRRVPVVLHYLHREPTAGWSFVDWMTLRRYDAIIAISHATRTALIDVYGLDPDRVIVAYPGVHGLTIEREPRNGAALRALYVGGLLGRKNLDLAIRGVARARGQGVDVTFDVAGEGPEQQRLQQLARSSGHGDAIRFLGRIDEDRKRQLLADADVFLFPSTLEGFGLAAAEALSCGVPVIGVNRSSIPEVVRHGHSGLLLDDPADDEAMAAALERLARDPGVRRTLGEAGRRDVESRFNPEAAAAAVADAYATVIRRPRR